MTISQRFDKNLMYRVLLVLLWSAVLLFSYTYLLASFFDALGVMQVLLLAMVFAMPVLLVIAYSVERGTAYEGERYLAYLSEIVRLQDEGKVIRMTENALRDIYGDKRVIFLEYRQIQTRTARESEKVDTENTRLVKRIRTLFGSKKFGNLIDIGHEYGMTYGKRVVDALDYCRNRRVAYILRTGPAGGSYFIILDKPLRIFANKRREDTFIRFVATALDMRYTHNAMSDRISRLKNKTASIKDAVNEELRKKISIIEKQRQRELDVMDIIGHELRTPLAMIKMALSLTRQKFLNIEDQDVKKWFAKMDSTISEALYRETATLEKMLSTTKLESSRMEVYFQKVSVIDLVQNTVFAYKTQAVQKGVRLTHGRVPKDLYIWADKTRIAEVLDNFVSNAVKYTERGKVRIMVEYDADTVSVRVVDTGIGISKRHMCKLGQKFYRVGQHLGGVRNGKSAYNVVRPGGTGLGLYVAFRLLHLMNAELIVDSRKGQGSTFGFRIARFKGQAEPPDDPDTKPRNMFRRLGWDAGGDDGRGATGEQSK